MIKANPNTCLSATHPQLTKQWHPTRNGLLTPEDVTAGTNKRTWWLCDKEHEWQAAANNRTSHGRGCPYCVGQKVCLDNCLSTTQPNLARQLHPTRNGSVTADNVTASSTKRLWWICEKGHEWEAACYSRKAGNGCPTCNESKGELAIAARLKEQNISFKQEVRFQSCRDKRPLPFDFQIYHNKKLGLIEYQGKQHYQPVCWRNSKHNNTEQSIADLIAVQRRDTIKRQWCESKNIPLLEIAYTELHRVEKTNRRFFTVPLR